MHRIILTAGLAAALLTSSIRAQNHHLPSDTPTTGTCNVIPFGTTNTSATWANQKYQCMATQAEIGNVPVAAICEIAFAPCGSGSGNQHFDTIEIVMAQTNAATLSSTFATNLMHNVKTVLKAENYDWHVTGDQWNRIGLDETYLYVAGNHPNIVIQITVTGNHKTGNHGTGFHRDGTHQRVYHVGWTTAMGPNPTGSTGSAALKWQISIGQADLNTFGVGCPGSAGTPQLDLVGDGKLGGTAGVSVSNLMNTAVVIHVVGIKRFEPRIDLGVLGAPSCYLYQTTDFVFGGVANASGVYSWRTAIPQNIAPCARAYTQVFASDANANTWGRTASNYGRILTGN